MPRRVRALATATLATLGAGATVPASVGTLAIAATAFAVSAAAAAGMDMTMSEFIFGSVADLFYLDVEMKGFSREGMIGIYGYFVSGYSHYRYDLGTIFAMGFKLHAGGNFRAIAKILPGYLEDKALVAFAITFAGRNNAGKAVA